MRVTTPGRNLGRHVFGAAAVASGLVTLVWHDYNDWNQPRYLVYAAGGAEIVGGVAIQFGRAAKLGAGVLCAVYLVFALLWRTANRRRTADLQQLGQFLRAAFAR